MFSGAQPNAALNAESEMAVCARTLYDERQQGMQELMQLLQATHSLSLHRIQIAGEQRLSIPDGHEAIAKQVRNVIFVSIRTLHVPVHRSKDELQA